LKSTVEFISMNLVAQRTQKIENINEVNGIVTVIFEKNNVIMDFTFFLKYASTFFMHNLGIMILLKTLGVVFVEQSIDIFYE